MFSKPGDYLRPYAVLDAATANGPKRTCGKAALVISRVGVEASRHRHGTVEGQIWTALVGLIGDSHRYEVHLGPDLDRRRNMVGES